MEYRIARNGNTYGPYTEAEVREHLATAHITATDIARTDAMEEWLPVSHLISLDTPRLSSYPDPPALPWKTALLLGILTLGMFFVVWDIVEAAWMRRVRPSSHALAIYILATVLFVINLPSSYNSVMQALFNGPAVDAPLAWWLGWVGLGVRLAARFSLRRSLCEHFNRTEPIGLRLSSFMTLVFGGLYFQYHFNRINEMKRALAASA